MLTAFFASSNTILCKGYVASLAIKMAVTVVWNSLPVIAIIGEVIFTLA